MKSYIAAFLCLAFILGVVAVPVSNGQFTPAAMLWRNSSTQLTPLRQCRWNRQESLISGRRKRGGTGRLPKWLLLSRAEGKRATGDENEC